MRRNLALLTLTLTLTAAASAQTPTVVEKPAVKTSTTTVKVGPQAVSHANAKPSPTTAAKPVSVQHATVSVQPAAVKVGSQKPPAPATNVAVAGKANVGASAKPVMAVAATSKPIAAGGAKAGAVSATKTTTTTTTVQAKTTTVSAKPATAVAQVKSPEKSGVKASPLSPKVHAAEVAAHNSSKSGTTVAVQDGKPITESKKWEPTRANANGRRDPFISPVVNMSAVGSGCSSGKRCLAIDQVALRGVVKSDVGMIAVVVNSLDKAYFLRENDPVFNGYVLKITGDSIVFKETFKDRLGKPLTRDVTKTITRPAV
jgi:Tfp pilus assembly protein PilP